MNTGADQAPPALVGIRVLDFTNLLAGPFPTLLLGFLGAEVIKVESRVQLDGARRPPYTYHDPDSSPVFNSLNLNKLSIQLDLKQPTALELVYRLAAISDAVVENLRPGVMERLGLGYQRLRQVNPSIIMTSASSAGATGPESSFPGYAAVFNALSGLGHLTGYPDAPPTELRDGVDARVGATTALAILSALFYRLRTGEGQYIDLSAREAITMCSAEALMECTMNGRVPQRQGNREKGMAPHGCYRCEGEDAWVSIAVGSEQEWQALCRATGNAEWALDPRFADPFLRYKNQDDLDPLIEGWTQRHSADEVVQVLQSFGVAAAPSMSSPALVEDPHLKGRGVWQEVQHPVLGRQKVQGPPWRLSRMPLTIRSPGPLLGQHNHHVFVQLLGLSPGEVEDLVNRRVIH